MSQPPIELKRNLRNNPEESNRTNRRLEYNENRIDTQIEDRGLEVYWEKSFLCPCRNPMTHAPDPSCSICHGRGIGYLEPKAIKMPIQSQDRSVSDVDIGYYDSGTAIGTTSRESGVTFRDRISLPQVFINQSILFDVNKKRIANGFHLPYDIHSFSLVLAKQGTELKELEEGTDFEISLNNNMFYPKEHLLGLNISLNVETQLRYIVIDLLKESRYQYTNKGTAFETFTDLPRKILLKREDAWVNPIPFSQDENEPDKAPEDTDWGDPKREMNKGGFFGRG